jgi:hypothetical protein
MNSNDDLMSITPRYNNRNNNNNYISRNSTPMEINNINNINLKPTVNVSRTSSKYIRPFPMNNNIFKGLKLPHRKTESSKEWGDPPFFTNAKPARMAERGLERVEEQDIRPGTKGVYIVNDGNETEVTVEQGLHYSEDAQLIYSLRTTDGTLIKPLHEDRFEHWDLYRHIKPIPFVPRRRRGGSRKNRRTRRNKKRSNRA